MGYLNILDLFVHDFCPDGLASGRLPDQFHDDGHIFLFLSKRAAVLCCDVQVRLWYPTGSRLWMASKVKSLAAG